LPYEKALIFNDLHIPFEDKKAVELTLRVGDKFQPDRIIIDGDLMDQWELSTFIKHPARRDASALAKEIIRGREFLADLRARFPKALIILVFGNHEYRWLRSLASNAPELALLKGLTLEEQLECEKSKIEVVNSGNRESSFMWGKLLIGHFDQINKHSGYTAKNLLEAKGVSLIQAHTHRGGSSFKRNWDRDIVAYENFCLCSRDPEYVSHPNWQLGFSLIYKDIQMVEGKVSDCFYVEPHPITAIERGSKVIYRTFFNGEIQQI